MNPGPSGRRSVAKGPTPEEEILTIQSQVKPKLIDRMMNLMNASITLRNIRGFNGIKSLPETQIF